jgi:uncharacterized protein (DUF305 family)
MRETMFASMMIPHHQQAIELSDLALKISKNPEVLQLAKEIKAAQAPEIEEMKLWGDVDTNMHSGHVMSGMLSEDELAALRKATGVEFDRAFLTGMIMHHQGAIEMAQSIINSRNHEVSSLARAIISTQKAEIERMKIILAK